MALSIDSNSSGKKCIFNFPTKIGSFNDISQYNTRLNMNFWIIDLRINCNLNWKLLYTARSTLGLKFWKYFEIQIKKNLSNFQCQIKIFSSKSSTILVFQMVWNIFWTAKKRKTFSLLTDEILYVFARYVCQLKKGYIDVTRRLIKCENGISMSSCIEKKVKGSVMEGKEQKRPLGSSIKHVHMERNLDETKPLFT